MHLLIKENLFQKKNKYGIMRMNIKYNSPELIKVLDSMIISQLYPSYSLSVI